MQEVTIWVTAMLTLVGFGLSLGINPALYGATADMLARGTNPWPRLLAMTGGLYLGATGLFVLFQFFNPTSFVSLVQHKAKDALFNHTVDLIAGILFLLLAAVVATWALRVKQLPHIEPKPPKENSHLSGYFTIGISSAVIGFTTLPIMYLVGRVTASLSSHWGPRIIAYAVFLVALAAPFFALAWVWRRFPRLSDRITEFYTRALSWDYRWLAACASALVGLALLWFAFFYHR